MQKRSREQWQALFVDQEASGLSAQQFCRDKKLCAQYFSLRKRQLGCAPASAFVRVQLRQAVVPVMTPAQIALSLSVRHRDGVLQFSHLPDPVFLARLMSALT